MKHLLLTLPLLFLSATAFSQSIELPKAVNVYGKAEIELSHSSDGLLTRTEKGTHIHSVFSRIGIEGSHALASDLKAVFKYELEVKGFDDENGKSPFKARNTYFGVQSARYGTLLLGRNDTRFKASEGSVDQFKEREGNLKQIFAGQDRLGDTVTFLAPKWSGLQLGATLVLEDDAKSNQGETGYSLSLLYGDSKLKKRPLYLAAAANKDLQGIDAWRLIGRFKLGQFRVGSLLQYARQTTGNNSGYGFMLNAAVPCNPKLIAKAQYSQDHARLVHKEDARMVTLGLDYLFDKQFKSYLMATRLKLESQQDSVLSLGLRYDF